MTLHIGISTCAGRLRRYLLFLSVALLSACEPQPVYEAGDLTACAPMPEARTAAVAFALGGKAYVFGGRGADGCTNTMYCYDPATNEWTGPLSTPLKPRMQATAAVLNGKAYVGLGFCGTIYQDSSYLCDWWRYDPVTNEWDSLAAYPDRGSTVHALSFVRDSLICCCNGNGPEVTNRMLRYDTRTDRWQSPLPSGTRALMGSAGATVGGRTYVGTGYSLDCKDDWYVIDLNGGGRHLRYAPVARTAAVAVGCGDRLYLIGGRLVRGSLTGGDVFGDVLRYEPVRDRWTRLGRLPEGCENAVAFCIGEKAYVGLGETFEGKLLNTFYRIDD